MAGDSAEDYRLKEEEAVIIDKATAASHKFHLREGKWTEGPADLRPKVTGQSLAMTLVAGDERFAPIASALRSVCVYAVFPDTLRRTAEARHRAPDETARRKLDHDSPRDGR